MVFGFQKAILGDEIIIVDEKIANVWNGFLSNRLSPVLSVLSSSSRIRDSRGLKMDFEQYDNNNSTFSSSPIALGTKKLITLKTSDDEEFKLDKSVAVKSEVIKNLVQDVDCTSNVIPLLNVDGKTMTKVIKYWKKHSDEGVTEVQLKNFDQDFLKMSHSKLFHVHLAARYLDDKQLEEVIIQESFDRITGKTLEEIREVFDIVNDYTPEEEEQVHRENAWAFK
ncbi:SKP1-like protein 11 [Solanum verrucosum]|uniref:SKP1-like protein 11 n=1 Tax=Solanum verrucosum TaxID=315347 RepID=UPI0020D11685|nr:SKP1-like protein 11 [Solanum verrucosum]